MKPITVRKLRKMLKELDQDALVMVPGEHQMYNYLTKDSMGHGVVEPSDDGEEFAYANGVHNEDWYEGGTDEELDDFATWRRVVVLEG
jgi:hypothetical protein